MRIALLEDDMAQAEFMLIVLESAEHTCQHFTACTPFLRVLRRETFDLLIIDWVLPDGNGLDVLKEIRSIIDWPIPVLFATSRSREDDIVQALQSGADDYMVKPVKQYELLARVEALARRAFPTRDNATTLEIGPYRFDSVQQTVTNAGEPVILTDKEFELAYFLFRNIGRLLSRGHLLQTIWGLQQDINTRTLDTHIFSIRKKLDINPEAGFRIKTVYRHGYRLEKIADDA